MEWFAAQPGGLPLAAAGLLGLLVGSFLNVVIHRVPRGESLVNPPSHCPGCGRAVAPWENVPVLSYLWLRGRCRGCSMRISLRYPMKTFINMLRDDRGASAAEYALILAIIGAVIAIAALTLSQAIGNAMNDTAACISNPTVGTC
jgi:prepilin signal peptidase PulO-like enzyme (type II secretory pathway)